MYCLVLHLLKHYFYGDKINDRSIAIPESTLLLLMS